MTEFLVPKDSSVIPMPDTLYADLPMQADYIMKLSTVANGYTAYPRLRFISDYHTSSYLPVVRTSAQYPINLLYGDLPWSISEDQFDNQVEMWVLTNTNTYTIPVIKTGVRGEITWANIQSNSYKFLIVKLKTYSNPDINAYEASGIIKYPRHFSTFGDLVVVTGTA